MGKRCATLMLFLVCCCPAPMWAQSPVASDSSGSQAAPPDSSGLKQGQAVSEETQPSRYPDPNLVPYRTRKSVLVHFLSLPAKVWRLIWSPLGAAMIWEEQHHIHQRLINFFLNDDRTGGFFPIISIGGNTGAAGGLTIFHNNLFNKRKRIRLTVLFNTEDNNSVRLMYSDSTLFGTPLFLDFGGEFLNDSDENFFIRPDVTQQELDDSSIRANESTENDETSYAVERGGFNVALGYALHRRTSIALTSRFQRSDIRRGEDEEAERFPITVPGFSTTSLFSVGAVVTVDFRNGWPRTLSGSLLRFAYQYNREVNGGRFEYNRFTIEAQQFIPVPFLALNRRLAVRGRFEKLDRLNGRQIPFYELSLLGDAWTLRGFEQNRFRGRGSLLFNVEYRYPVWDTWDAVIFIDEGQVFDDLNEIDFERFHFAIGTGFRFMSRRGFLFRVEVGFSRETIRGLFQITPNF
ncbi:MAG: hypothetical protein D6743_08265 [Calditrichaeota bacterium]|nr:MAG: hypothetical protein D6743_08265 [Calditrichota bacterium]